MAVREQLFVVVGRAKHYRQICFGRTTDIKAMAVGFMFQHVTRLREREHKEWQATQFAPWDNSRPFFWHCQQKRGFVWNWVEIMEKEFPSHCSGFNMLCAHDQTSFDGWKALMPIHFKIFWNEHRHDLVMVYDHTKCMDFCSGSGGQSGLTTVVTDMTHNLFWTCFFLFFSVCTLDFLSFCADFTDCSFSRASLVFIWEECVLFCDQNVCGLEIVENLCRMWPGHFKYVNSSCNNVYRKFDSAGEISDKPREIFFFGMTVGWTSIEIWAWWPRGGLIVVPKRS